RSSTSTGPGKRWARQSPGYASWSREFKPILPSVTPKNGRTEEISRFLADSLDTAREWTDLAFPATEPSQKEATRRSEDERKQREKERVRQQSIQEEAKCQSQVERKQWEQRQQVAEIIRTVAKAFVGSVLGMVISFIAMGIVGLLMSPLLCLA